jgi:hypothetical protein
VKFVDKAIARISLYIIMQLDYFHTILLATIIPQQLQNVMMSMLLGLLVR